MLLLKRLNQQSPVYRVDYEWVLHGVACLLHVSNPLKLLLVIFAVHVLILRKHNDLSLLQIAYESMPTKRKQQFGVTYLCLRVLKAILAVF